MEQTISLTEKELLITTPYFIPGQKIMDALVVAAMSGVQIKLLVPGQSDSEFINMAARSYYGELMEAGVEIYQYKKGFIHAKTVVSDGELAIVGTANMDNRSFEMNFEVISMIYDQKTAEELRGVFYEDLKHSVRISLRSWKKRPFYKRLLERLVRLFSPLL